MVIDGRSEAVIVAGEHVGQLGQLAARELQDYLDKLTGVRTEIIKPSQLPAQPGNRTLLVLGGPAQNEAARQLEKVGLVEFAGIQAEGFILKTVRWNQHPTIVIGGIDEAGTLYATYELLEQFGFTFRLTGDIVPQPTRNLSLAELDLRMEPACSRRGFLLGMCFDNVAAFSYQDYVKLLDQMARMKCNYLQFWWFPYAPWLSYSYRGEGKLMGDVARKESGYHSWTYNGFGSRTIEDISIGRHHFKNHPRIAPLELQQVETPAEAFDVSQELLRRVIDHAHRRNIKVWLVVELASLPPNLARYGEMIGPKPFIFVFGSFLHPQDPVNREIQVNRLKALQESYPDADGYFFNFSELYPDLVTPEHRDFYIDQRPNFHALRKLYYPWSGHLANLYGVDEEQMLNSNVGYMDLFQYLLLQRDKVVPRAKVGLMTVGHIAASLPVIRKDLCSTGLTWPGRIHRPA